MRQCRFWLSVLAQNCCFSSVSPPMSTTNAFAGLHVKCRDTSEPYKRTAPPLKRFPVTDDKVSWQIPFPEYAPPDYTDAIVLSAPWADPLTENQQFHPAWNKVDGKINRTSHVCVYQLEDGRPLNVLGRTGLKGRGCLGKWGPNHAADPIVTRWKRQKHGALVVNPDTKLPVLQFVAIERRDCHQWAIPGGMVDPGEKVTTTLRREFGEEAFNTLEMDAEKKHKLEQSLAQFFAQGQDIYRGYVDDPRNTDNSWMETVAVNFHDQNGDIVGQFPLHAGDDAVGVRWMDVDSSVQLYASHRQFIENVAKLHKAHW